MKNLVILTCLLCAVVAVPIPDPAPEAKPESSLELLQIPLKGNKELDIISLPEDNGQLTERNKRTIGMLRELFPTLSQIIDKKIQMIAQYLFRTVGPVLLRSGLGGAGGTSSRNSGDDDDFDSDDDDDASSSSSGQTNISTGGRKVSISLPTLAPGFDDDDDDEDDAAVVATSTSTTTTTTTEIPTSNESFDNDEPIPAIIDTINVKTDASNQLTIADGYLPSSNLDNDNDANTNDSQQKNQNLISGNGKIDASIINEALASIRVARETSDDVGDASQDQHTAESKGPALDELSLDGEEDTDENRNKRFLSFGGQSGGASGGSGNFLFDIIRRTADRAARAAGTIYRVVAGTETLGALQQSTNTQISVSSTRAQLKQQQQDNNSDDTSFEELKLDDDDLKADQQTTRPKSGLISLLVSGSSGTEQNDERANSADDTDEGVTKSADGYTEGIPGPVTRLFVLVNRGLSNLVQDLILRLAQTSERVVNFKARLITSLI